MTSRTATLIGLTAILMWSLLAVLTVATGKIPAFQLAAMTFAIGALVGFLTWIGRPDAFGALRQPPLAWIVGVGGLFGYHALYFLALRFAPPAEAGLLNYLWPLLIVLFSSLLPGERLAPHHIVGALLGLAGTVLLFAGNSGSGFAPGQLPGLIAAFVAAFVWAAYSVMSRKLKSVPTDAVAGFCLVTALLAALVHAGRGHGLARDGGAMAGDRRARHRAGRCCVLRLGHRHEARRHPRARRRVLRDAAAVDRFSDPGGLCQAERHDRDRRGADRRRRLDRGEGYGSARNGSALEAKPSGVPDLSAASSNFAKSKPRRDGAADQRPVAGAFGGLPGLRRHDRLRYFAGGEIGTEPDAASAIAIGDLQHQRAAGVIVPDLHRIDAMPVRAFAARQQEIDRGGDASGRRRRRAGRETSRDNGRLRDAASIQAAR